MNIKARIAKLLAMTTSRGCTEAEALAATRHVQRLMTEHRISHADLAGTDTEPIGLGVLYQSRRAWAKILTSAVARANGCRTLVITGTGAIWVIGTERNREATVQVFTLVIAQLNALADLRCRGKGRAYKYDYCAGMTVSITERLLEGVKRAEQKASERALVCLNAEQQRVDEYMNTHYRTKKTVLREASDEHAYNLGRADGRGVYINRVLEES